MFWKNHGSLSEELCEKLDYFTGDGRGKIYYSAYRDVMNLNRREA